MIRLTVSALCLALACGCAGESAPKPPDLGGADGLAVAAVIEELNDAITSAKKFEAVFAKGAKPADMKKYGKFSYSVVGKPVVNGTAATSKVRVDDATGKVAGEVEWGFEREGDKWKLKSAPLP